MIGIKQKKTWQEEHDRIAPDIQKMDGLAETKAMDAFMEDRSKQTALSSKDRKWEEDRKKEWAKNKPAYMKKLEERPNLLKNLIKDVKTGGSFQTNLHPFPGYILTKIEKIPEKTSTGIYLPENIEETPNTARVIEVGDGYWIFNDHYQEPLVVPGQMVVFRKLAGMEVKIKGIDYLVLHFTDLIMVVGD